MVKQAKENLSKADEKNMSGAPDNGQDAEEKSADQKLSALAEGGINRRAA